ncbi:MAG: hypothetical protein IKZ33_09320 [Lentisphaeria bacterium]|nr:hypothetical protein [Lentisphaeria bacterium]
MDTIKMIKILLLCIAVPFVIAFFIFVILPFLIVFLLVGAIFAPHRIRGTFQQFRKKTTPQQKPDDSNIDVECTVLESKEISSDS